MDPSFLWIVVLLLALKIVTRIIRSRSEKTEQVSDELSIKLEETTMDPDKPSPRALRVLIKGSIPVVQVTEMSVIVNLADVTNEESSPVISMIPQYQYPNSAWFRQVSDCGFVSPGAIISDWMQIGFIIPESLVLPYRGDRRVKVICQFVKTEDLQSLKNGVENKISVTAILSDIFLYSQVYPGYVEKFENRKSSLILASKIAVVISNSDGLVDEAEIGVIKRWISKILTQYNLEDSNSLKEDFNNATREITEEINNNAAELNRLVDDFNNVAGAQEKFEALELFFDVISADGNLNREELDLINDLAVKMDIDPKMLESVRDRKLIDFKDPLHTDNIDIERTLGIDSSWSKEQIRRHLSSEFNKWNSRVTSLPEGEERQKAQSMIDLISMARTRYA